MGMVPVDTEITCEMRLDSPAGSPGLHYSSDLSIVAIPPPTSYKRCAFADLLDPRDASIDHHRVMTTSSLPFATTSLSFLPQSPVASPTNTTWPLPTFTSLLDYPPSRAGFSMAPQSCPPRQHHSLPVSVPHWSRPNWARVRQNTFSPIPRITLVVRELLLA